MMKNTEFCWICTSWTGAPELLDLEQVIPPGGRAPHGVGVHDAQVFALRNRAARTGSNLEMEQQNSSSLKQNKFDCEDIDLI